ILYRLLYSDLNLYFFFSSRRRHTRFSRDWSSDVCSSDLDFSSRWIFDLDDDTAFQQSMALAEIILSQLESATELDDASRAWEWVQSWGEQHRTKFSDEATERFGWIEQGDVYMLPTAFQRCMTEGGFSERRILRDFAERGLIETVEEGGKIRHKPKKEFRGKWVRVVVLRTAEKWEKNTGSGNSGKEVGMAQSQ